ncbi:Chromosome transmission fidelity protein 8-like [Lamellibrachia satsuma]|nr:Chromosome transmission fidelity protein 8-like [Lamellibrachia satsuma]
MKIMDGECPEWAIIELQGDLEIRSEVSSLSGRFVGDLHFTKQGVPVFIIGHHILYGKCQQLEKPIAVMTKTTPSMDREAGHDDDVTYDNMDPHYLVKAIVKKKVLFKTRPKPIIANVPKRL